MGRLKSVSINERAATCFNGKPDEMPPPCCEEISEELKIKEITQVNFDFDATPHLYPLISFSFIAFDQHWKAIDLTSFDDGLDPPPLGNYSIHVLHKVFLI